jgi:hypothetical protein
MVAPIESLMLSASCLTQNSNAPKRIRGAKGQRQVLLDMLLHAQKGLEKMLVMCFDGWQ